MKNILVEVDNEYHDKVKIHAVTHGMTIKEYVTGLIDKDLETKKKSKHSNFGEYVFAQAIRK
ncbi:MAG: hypothetical protein UFG06_05265 [Lachnospiraceae bacterium]|nr:hypothetical protein [Lachnospiraceae bacterium]